MRAEESCSTSIVCPCVATIQASHTFSIDNGVARPHLRQGQIFCIGQVFEIRSHGRSSNSFPSSLKMRSRSSAARSKS
jgi:hypothetical protein